MAQVGHVAGVRRSFAQVVAPLNVTSRTPNTPWPGSVTVTGERLSVSSA